MKRFEIQGYTDFGWIPRFQMGFMDKRRKKIAYKWIRAGWAYWHVQFNYRLVDHSAYKEEGIP
jgi:hypothetical protein